MGYRGGVRLDEDGGGLRKTRHRGTARVGWMFTFVAATYNLVRLPKLLAGATSDARTLSKRMVQTAGVAENG